MYIEPIEKDEIMTKRFSKINGKINFKKVNFEYEKNEKSLKDIQHYLP